MPVITGNDAAHIVQVLRHKVGDFIALFDGHGNEYEAEIMTLSPGRVQVSILRQIAAEGEAPIQIIVAQGFLKEKKMDLVVRQLSEIGAAHWIPFPAGRSVAVPNKKRILHRKERWEKIAVESAKQCGRNRVLTIDPTPSFEQLLNKCSDCEIRILFYEKEPRCFDAALVETNIRQGSKIAIILGPEGGFDPQEIQTARDNGFVTAGLGPRILRAETAPIVACTLVQYIFGDLCQQSA